MKKIFFILFALFVSTQAWCGDRLFHISRSLNKNVVAYDLVLNGNKLNAKDPIHAYWHNLEKTPATTEELNYIQRKLAYGYNIVSNNGDEATFTMKALNKRNVKIRKVKGKWMAIITINGKECQLTEVFAHCPTKTSVDYIDIKGKALADGSAQTERVKN